MYPRRGPKRQYPKKQKCLTLNPFCPIRIGSRYIIIVIQAVPNGKHTRRARASLRKKRESIGTRP